MEAIAQGLWALAEKHEKEGCIAQSLKCLEAICQSHVSFLPTVEVKTRLWIASLLLRHSDNVTYARTHLERAVKTPHLLGMPRNNDRWLICFNLFFSFSSCWIPLCVARVGHQVWGYGRWTWGLRFMLLVLQIANSVPHYRFDTAGAICLFRSVQ